MPRLRQGWRLVFPWGRQALGPRPLAVWAAAATLLTAAPGVSAPPPTAPLPVPEAAAPAAAASHRQVTYGGWAAGYLATAPARQPFTAISARFVLPKAGPRHAPPAGSPAWISIWTGIGIQAQGGDLMQAGISLLAAPGGGWQLAAPWWINEPATPVQPHPLDLAVAPGDEIQVDVRDIDRAAGTWVFTVQDLTSSAHAAGWCYDCTADGRTAAWVEEDPLDGGNPAAFADPGRVRFESASAAVNGGDLVPLPQTAWQPLIRTLGALTTYVPASDAPTPKDSGQVAATITPVLQSPSAGAAAAGPLAAPADGGAFTIGALQPAATPLGSASVGG